MRRKLSEYEKEQLEWFAGSREWNEHVAKLHNELQENISCELYRGLPYQEHLINEGTIIEEWYGSSHWTIDKDIAANFSRDYISEGLIEEIIEERNITEDEAYELFVPLILHMDNAVGVPLYKYVPAFEHEKEINIHGKNFVLYNTWKDGDTYHANVKAIPR